MEYRLLRTDDRDAYVSIYNEETSEQIGTVRRGKKWGIFRYYVLDLNGTSHTISHKILDRTRWTIDSSKDVIKFGWILFSNDVKIESDQGEFHSDVKRSQKWELLNEKGRTASILNFEHFTSPNMLLLQDYERLRIETVLAASILFSDRHGLWDK